jgi:hypothetical protein
MPAAPFFAGIVGMRGEFPNNADRDNKTSVRIARALMGRVLAGADARVALPEDAAGTELERAVEDDLAATLPTLDPDRPWEITRRRLITGFAQYQHLARINELVAQDETLRVELGGDYVIKPDVTVGVVTEEAPTLHAAISCKWTIRSDRVQNIRHEAVVLMRNRRGRQPHIVSVTAEPLPSRLASIAMGTGEVDAVYHVALDELVAATTDAGNPKQLAILTTLIAQRRLLDYSTLADTLATT